ncbi:MAG: hypothetical protein Ta2G_10060 [Termitinemataceae bacterium]|nr:MAG: hypothetical protein Ta2G_10060 [Termitinemataceae bacterium]
MKVILKSHYNFLSMKKSFVICLFFSFLIFGNTVLFAEDADSEKELLPLKYVFHEFGWNTLHSLTYNYGANFLGAGLGTWLFVESGIDWAWRNFDYNNESLANAAYNITVYSGFVIPVGNTCFILDCNFNNTR